MRFMMLMIPRGYEKAAPGTLPDAKGVEAMRSTTKLCRKLACFSLWTAFTRHPWARASRFPAASRR